MPLTDVRHRKRSLLTGRADELADVEMSQSSRIIAAIDSTVLESHDPCKPTRTDVTDDLRTERKTT